MTNIKDAIDKWLSEWSECVECNHMIRNDKLLSNNEDELICDECN